MTTRATPLISVVIPAYNHAAYIQQALQSVYDQDYEAIELIVFDDCSRDATAAIARNFLERPDVRARFRRVVCEINDRNLGAHATIDEAIQCSRGQFVNILNSDDYFAPDRLSVLAECLSGDAKLAFSRVNLVVESAKTLPSVRDYFCAIQDSIPLFPTVGYALLRNQCALSTGNLFFARAVYDEIGGFRDLKYCHDWDFILRSVVVSEPVFVDRPLYFYRLHESNSFLDLQSVAQRETETVLRNYFFLCRNRPVTNPLAPSPAWGPFFDSFVRHANYSRYLSKP